MEIFFSEIARQVALIIASISLVGMMTFLVSYLVTRIWAYIRQARATTHQEASATSTPKQIIASDTPMIIAEIHLPSESHIAVEESSTSDKADEKAEKELSDSEVPHDDAPMSPVIESQKTWAESLWDQVISEDQESKDEEKEAPKEAATFTSQELSTQTESAPEEPISPKKEEIERIKKPDTSSLQGDIYVSSIPHTDKKSSTDSTETISGEDTQSSVSGELVDTIKTHVRRKEYSKAHTLIVEWLSYSKDHRELNVLLAEIYEVEWAYDRAELLYADIIRKHGKDAHLLSKLALMLSFGGKYETSLELYREALLLERENDEIITMVMNLSAYLGYHKESFDLTEEYLTKYPRHIDSLELQAKNTIELGYEDRYQEIITLLRSLAGFDARTHARVADLIALHESRVGGNPR